MRSAPRSFTRLGIGAFTGLLALVLLFMLAGLIAMDEVLRAAGAAHASSDADHAARAMEFQLAARAEDMGAFGSVILTELPEERRAESLDILAASVVGSRPAAMYFGLVDSAGAVVYSRWFRGMGGDSPGETLNAIRSDLSPTRRAHARLVRLEGSETPALAVGKRLDIPSSGPWAAIALFDVHELAGNIAGSFVPLEDGVTLMAGGDTLWFRAGASAGGSAAHGTGTVGLPGGSTWTLSVSRVHGYRAMRLVLWALGLLTLLLLASGMIRERRQATRVAERSAELERLSSELIRANRMKSEFLANVSHELRTPLNAIVGFVELLKDGVYGNLSPRQVPPVDRIAVSATHLRRLVDQVLDIAKIAAGRVEVHTESITLRTFVLNIASELESLFAERNLHLSISVPAAMPQLRTDPLHLRQILVNLIGNAVTYTPSGSITIRARLVGAGDPRRTPDDPSLSEKAPDRIRAWVALQVVDSGVGIAEKDHERIFDEFEQVNAGSRGDSLSRGTGLGLPISRRLARLLGGDITVESEVGKGSAFTVWMPLDEPGLSSIPYPDVPREAVPG